MKKLILLSILILILFFTKNASAQNMVSGNVSGNWTIENSPYIVIGNINVIDSLIIEPGVTVQFQAGGLQIEAGAGAKLNAKGTENNKITFEPFLGSSPGSYVGIVLTESGNDDTLEYCIIRNATTGVYSYNSSPTINECSIFGNSDYGIFSSILVGHYSSKITNCYLYDNLNSGIRVSGYDRYGAASDTVIVDHCTIYNNGQNGIIVYSGTWWSWGTAYSLAKISNCTIYNNETGVRAYAYRGYADATVTNSIVASNKGYGIANQDSRSYIGSNDIIYNCFWNNTIGNFTSEISGSGFGQNGPYQNFNNDSCDINFNIYNNPLIIATASFDFNLLDGSKCINAGTPITNGLYVLDSNGTFPEIGGYYFNLAITITAPTGLQAIADSESQITLNWTDNSNDEDGFEIYRSIKSDSDYGLIQTTAVDEITYTDVDLNDGTIYFYKIRAKSNTGVSSFTDEVSTTTFNVIPAVPSDLQATADSENQISLSWADNSDNEGGFEIQRSITSGMGFSPIATTGVNEISYVDTGLTVFTVYYYKVRSFNSAGFSSFTEEASDTTLDLPTNASPTFSMPDAITFINNTSSVLNMWDYADDAETSDPDLIYTFSVSDASLLWSFDSGTGELTLTAPGFDGTAKLYASITDEAGASAYDTLVVVVSLPNEPPTLSMPDTVTFINNSSSVLNMWDYTDDDETSDPDLTYSFSVSDASLIWDFDSGTGELTLTAPGFEGTAKLYASITDEAGISAYDTLVAVVTLAVGIENPQDISLQYILQQNYPNPFNRLTTIGFSLPEASDVLIEIYDITGTRISTLLDEYKPAGNHKLILDGAKLTGGVYFYEIKTGKFIKMRKMLLVK